MKNISKISLCFVFIIGLTVTAGRPMIKDFANKVLLLNKRHFSTNTLLLALSKENYKGLRKLIKKTIKNSGDLDFENYYIDVRDKQQDFIEGLKKKILKNKRFEETSNDDWIKLLGEIIFDERRKLAQQKRRGYYDEETPYELEKSDSDE